MMVYSVVIDSVSEVPAGGSPNTATMTGSRVVMSIEVLWSFQFPRSSSLITAVVQTREELTKRPGEDEGGGLHKWKESRNIAIYPYYKAEKNKHVPGNI